MKTKLVSRKIIDFLGYDHLRLCFNYRRKYMAIIWGRVQMGNFLCGPAKARALTYWPVSDSKNAPLQTINELPLSRRKTRTRPARN